MHLHLSFKELCATAGVRWSVKCDVFLVNLGTIFLLREVVREKEQISRSHAMRLGKLSESESLTAVYHKSTPMQLSAQLTLKMMRC